MKKISPIEIWTLRIGNFAAQIENDPGGLIPGTMAEGDQRKILRLVVGSNFSWVIRDFFKLRCIFVVTACAYLLNMCDAPRYFAK